MGVGHREKGAGRSPTWEGLPCMNKPRPPPPVMQSIQDTVCSQSTSESSDSRKTRPGWHKERSRCPAKANEIEPYEYLLYVLKHIASADTVEKLEALLPWNMKSESNQGR